MRTTVAVTVCAALVALAGCAGSPQPAPADPQPVTSQPPATAAPSTPAASETDTPTTPTTPASPAPKASAVTITKGGRTVEFTPARVYCEDRPGDLDHVIAKGAQGLPIVEWDKDGFAMVKLENRGAPDKTTSPSGVTVSAESITFADTVIGQATVSGSLTCTHFEKDDDD